MCCEKTIIWEAILPKHYFKNEMGANRNDTVKLDKGAIGT